MEHRANPIPFVLAGVLVLMAVLVGMRGCTGREPTTTEASMQKVPEAPTSLSYSARSAGPLQHAATT